MKYYYYFFLFLNGVVAPKTPLRPRSYGGTPTLLELYTDPILNPPATKNVDEQNDCDPPLSLLSRARSRLPSARIELLQQQPRTTGTTQPLTASQALQLRPNRSDLIRQQQQRQRQHETLTLASQPNLDLTWLRRSRQQQQQHEARLSRIHNSHFSAYDAQVQQEQERQEQERQERERQECEQQEVERHEHIMPTPPSNSSNYTMSNMGDNSSQQLFGPNLLESHRKRVRNETSQLCSNETSQLRRKKQKRNHKQKQKAEKKCKMLETSKKLIADNSLIGLQPSYPPSNLDAVEEWAFFNAQEKGSNKWAKRAVHRFTCKHCDAKLVLKKFEEDFYLTKFCAHTCKYVRKTTADGKRCAGLSNVPPGFSAESLADSLNLIIERNPLVKVPELMAIIESFITPLIKECGLAKGHYNLVHRAREIVRKREHGETTDFQLLTSLKSIMSEIDLQTHFTFEVNENREYQSMLLIPGQFIRAALFCAPVLSMDAAFMKPLGTRSALGKMYVFSTKDGNNNIHLSIGHGGQETTDTWASMLKPLFDLVIHPHKMSLISDEHASICPAIARCDDTFTKWTACIKHRQGNVKLYYGVEAAELFHAAAKCYTCKQLDEVKSKIKDLDENSKPGLWNYCFAEYLDADGVFRTVNENFYYRPKMFYLDAEGNDVPFYRGGILSTQTSEVLNGAPGSSRSFFGGFWRYRHPVSMVITAYNWYVNRFPELEQLAQRMKGKLTPFAESIITQRLEAAERCTSTTQVESLAAAAFARDPTRGAEIQTVYDTDENSYHCVNVNLRYKTCSCNMWQEHEIPCKHACTLYLRRHEDPRDHVAPRYKLQTYRLMFQVMDLQPPVTQAQLIARGRNESIKEPAHGEETTIFDKKTQRDITVCLCQFCGKKNVHKKPGPGQTARRTRRGKDHGDC